MHLPTRGPGGRFRPPHDLLISLRDWSKSPVSATIRAMRRPFAPAAALSLALSSLCVASLWPAPAAFAQDAGTAEQPSQPVDSPAVDDTAIDDTAIPEPPAESEPQPFEERAPEEEPEELDPLPLPPPSDQRQQLHLDDDLDPPAPGGEGDPSIEEFEEQLDPTLVMPEFRVRIGGGVSIATSGTDTILARTTQELEWLPPVLQFLTVGVGAAEMFGPAGTSGQVGVRVGGYAWFCDDPLVRCMGAITIQLGAIFGAIGPDFDFSADADLRFLFDKTFELHVRGGFFSVGTLSFVDITAGVGLAF